MLSLILVAGISVFIVATIIWLISILIKDSSIADVGWGIYFITVAVALLIRTSHHSTIQIIDSLLVIVWGLRLAIHIGSRKIGKPEDWRYAQWRKDWGKLFLVRSYVQNFLFQGLLALVVSFSTIVIAHASDVGRVVHWWQILAILIWAFGFFFESVGDYQLSKFIKARKVKGTIMTTGLWKYTRHPNYFGEITQWWGLWILAIGYSYGLIAVVSPILITYLIVYVSGIPLLEKHYHDNAAYQIYATSTPKLIPIIKF